MSPMNTHIPAWKKIGLKLKYAKQEAEEPPSQYFRAISNEATPDVSKKRKAPSPSVPTTTASPLESLLKKVRKIKKTGDPVLDGVTELNAMLSKYQAALPPMEKGDDTLEAAEGKRKSVSFTPETKAEDGSSLKDVYGAWLKAQQAEDPVFDAKQLDPALRVTENGNGAGKVYPSPVVDIEVDKSSAHASLLSREAQDATSHSSPLLPQVEAQAQPFKKKKENSRSKTKTKTKINKIKSPKPDIDPSSPHLIYLTHHHTNPSIWKFSKPTQNHILKHLFSLRQIPTTYDPALLSYLSGLKGALARQRIRTQALDLRREDEAWLSRSPPSSPAEPSGAKSADDEKNKIDTEKAAEMDAPTLLPDTERHARRKEAYEAEVRRLKTLLRKKEYEREDHEWALRGEKEWERRFLRRKRAEVVLWGIGEAEEAVEPVRKKVHVEKSAVEREAGGGSKGDSRVMQANDLGNGNGVVAGLGGGNWMYGREAGKLNGGVPKKIVFTDDDDGVGAGPGTGTGIGGTNGTVPANKIAAPTDVMANGRRGPRKRKVKKRTGVPDDDETSSSSDSSSESEKDGEVRLERVLSKALGRGDGTRVGKGMFGIGEESESSSSCSGSETESDDESG